MKSKLATILIALVFIAGLSVLLYPYVADYINAQRQSRFVAQYYRDLETLAEEDFTTLIAAAMAYNEALLYDSDRFEFSEEDSAEYMALLNPFGNNIMGTLVIDAIGVHLPIFQGSSEDSLQLGAGHFEGTSLPVGGLGTHSAILGHRGLPASTLLTHLDRLAVGDTFVLNVLNEVLTYEIDRILVVEPDDVDALMIQPGMDFCTLVTCTPYGINSHRMLLRGFRIANAAVPLDGPAAEETSATAWPELTRILLIAAAIATPILIAGAVFAGSRWKTSTGSRRVLKRSLR